MQILPNKYAVGAAAVFPSLLGQSSSSAFLRGYGLFGELARVGGIGGLLAVIMYVCSNLPQFSVSMLISYHSIAAERSFLMDSYRRLKS